MTGGAPVVRPARVADAVAIGTIHVGAWRVAYRGLVPDAVLDGFSTEARIARWQRVLAGRPADDPRRTWVVASGATVTGFATTGPARDESAPPPLGAGEIEAIYLDPRWIGRGHGRALFGLAVRDLIERGYDPLVVWVFEANAQGRRFYEAAGFRLDDARNDIDFGADAIVPEVRFRLDVGASAS